MSQRSKYCLVGVPDHQGVQNVGGRLGAAAGPQAMRRAFARLNGRIPVRDGLRDAGDVEGIGPDVAANHRAAAALIAREHGAAGVSVVVGGGHDHGYSHLVGVAETLGSSGRLGCINIDAHLDLRRPEPLITSGSPFYLALESGVLEPRRFVEFGIQSQCNAPALWQYAERRKLDIVPFERLRGGGAVRGFERALRRLCAASGAVVVSLDLDAAAQAYAPGTSAPQSEGFTPSELVAMAEVAGREPKVVSLGLFELNPVHDIDDRTAKLAATVAWHFLEQVGGRRKAPRKAPARKARRT